MTTIAYKDGVIAYDSRLTADNSITSDNAEKMEMKDGYRFLLTGSVSAGQRLVRDWPDVEGKEYECSGLMVDKDGSIWEVCGDNHFSMWRPVPGEPYANGSGVDHAYTAMDLGLSAEDAVKAAMKRDTCTGGRVRTFIVADSAESMRQ